MTKTHIQMAGLIILAFLAGGLLFLVGYTFHSAIGKVTPDGKVPLADAGLFTAFLLSFQQIVGAMRSIWESQERVAMAEGLSNSVPTQTPTPPTEDLDSDGEAK